MSRPDIKTLIATAADGSVWVLNSPLPTELITEAWTRISPPLTPEDLCGLAPQTWCEPAAQPTSEAVSQELLHGWRKLGAKVVVATQSPEDAIGFGRPEK